MSNVDNLLRARAEAFVLELSLVIRHAVLQEIADAINHAAEKAAPPRAVAPAAARKPGRPAKAPAPAPAPARKPGRPAKAPAPALRPGQQRTPEFLAQLMGRVHQHIKANPGHGVGAIAGALNTSTKELSLLLRKLVNENKIVSMGKKRGTRYMPR